MSKYDFDIGVIGGGSAGLRLLFNRAFYIFFLYPQDYQKNQRCRGLIAYQAIFWSVLEAS